jgi:hypothetical protein
MRLIERWTGMIDQSRTEDWNESKKIEGLKKRIEITKKMQTKRSSAIERKMRQMKKWMTSEGSRMMQRQPMKRIQRRNERVKMMKRQIKTAKTSKLRQQ